MRREQQGFTLLELIIVVGIIGILAAVSVVKFVQLIDKARETVTKANMGALRSSIAIYFADARGVWPKELDMNSWQIGDERFPAFIPRYIRQVPRVSLRRAVPHSDSNAVEPVETTPVQQIGPDMISDKGGWVYSSASGDVRVNCNHRDTESTTDDNSTIYYSNYGHES